MKNVVFDLDGTLLDTLEDLENCVNKTLARFGLPPRNTRQIRAALGNGSARLLKESMPGHEELLQEALVYYHSVYPPKTGAMTRPYPGIPALMAQLQKAGWGIGILSNKPHGAVLSLRDEFFPGVPAAGDREGTPRKPDPTALFALMKQEGFAPEESVYVGDSEVDVQLARNASLPCVAVSWGYRDRPALTEAGAALIAVSTEELWKILQAL